VNSGTYCFAAPLVFEMLREITPDNNQGEYYLTDVIERLIARGQRVGAVEAPDARMAAGINDRAQLAEIEAGLRKAYDAVRGAKYRVQVTHNPPFGTRADMLPSGLHVGSKAVRMLIEELKPEVAVCAHIHEARGVDELGTTKIINPGRLPEGYCGIVEIKDGIVSAEIVNLI